MYNFLMIIATLMVGAAIVGTLVWFFRRLREIEDDNGIAVPQESFREMLQELILRIRHRARRE